MRILSILGSTGSIGTQTLEVVRSNPDVKVAALAAKENIELLEQQAREFHPSLVGVYEESRAADLRLRLRDTDILVVSGMEGLIACALAEEADMVVSAVVGMIGIQPVMEAIRAGKDIAFANKETLVTAGHLIMPLVKQCGVRLLPVDSEHSAIFQAIQGNRYFHEKDAGGGNPEIEKSYLPRPEGRFTEKYEELSNVTVEDALKHPNWSMGRKITVDSATMVNKGLEVMEASWLFGVPPEKIEVVIEPKSVIHSAVEFVDGGIIAQLGVPDMRLPIQYALFYPERRFLQGKRLSLTEIGNISFGKPDLKELPGLSLAYRAMKEGGSMPVVYNAANEYAVGQFLEKKINFHGIMNLIEKAMNRHETIKNPDLFTIISIEKETYTRLQCEEKA